MVSPLFESLSNAILRLYGDTVYEIYSWRQDLANKARAFTSDPVQLRYFDRPRRDLNLGPTRQNGAAAHFMGEPPLTSMRFSRFWFSVFPAIFALFSRYFYDFFDIFCNFVFNYLTIFDNI